MRKQILPDDILIAVAHYLPEGRKCFRYGAEKLNSFFYQQKQKHPELFRSLLFNNNGTSPYCDEIYQAVSNLFASGLVVVASNKPWDYNFHSAIECSFKRFVSKRFSRQQLNQLEKVAKEFDEQVAISSIIKFD